MKNKFQKVLLKVLILNIKQLHLHIIKHLN